MSGDSTTEQEAGVPAQTTDERLEQIRDWVTERHPECEIDLDTDLIDHVLDGSMEFVSLLIHVEEVRGGGIATDQVDPEYFRTLRSIGEHFLT